MSLTRKYRIVPTSSPWVSEDVKHLTHAITFMQTQKNLATVSLYI